MKAKTILTISITIVVTLTLLIPSPSFAQGDGGRKKKKKIQTEQTTPARKPSKRPTKPTISASKKVSISDPTGYYSGHGYVDLELPSGLKWATCNVGASSPFDYGDYFAWGEITPKSKYTQDNSKTFGKQIDDISGNPDYDAAQYIWGISWRIPTKAEWQELINKCKWMWTTINVLCHMKFVELTSYGFVKLVISWLGAIDFMDTIYVQSPINRIDLKLISWTNSTISYRMH